MYPRDRRVHYFPEAFRIFVKSRSLEVVGLALLALAAFLFLSFLTYDPSDSSLNVLSTLDHARNAFHEEGALVADLFLQYIGWASLAFPACFTLWALRAFSHRPINMPFKRLLMVAGSTLFLNFSLSSLNYSMTPLHGWIAINQETGILGLMVAHQIHEVLDAFHLGILMLPIAGLSFLVFAVCFFFAAAFSLGEWRSLGGAVLTVLQKCFVAGIWLWGKWKNYVQFSFVARTEKGSTDERHADTTKDKGIHRQVNWGDQDWETLNETSPDIRGASGGTHGGPGGRDAFALDDVYGSASAYDATGYGSAGSGGAAVSHAAQKSVSRGSVSYGPVAGSPYGGIDIPFDDDEAVGPTSGVQTFLSDPVSARGSEKTAAALKSASSSAKSTLKPLRLRTDDCYTLPDLNLLQEPDRSAQPILTRDELEANIQALAQVLEDYGVKGKIVGAKPGPVVTLYELEPAPGIKSSRIIGLADDIARSMHALSARIAVVPGKNLMGIELPNQKRHTVYLKELLASREFDNDQAKLNLALGKNISGTPVLTDLARMPHMIVAGTTGSGKSVGINAMILSLLYRHSPDTCRLILIDPKMLEFSMYNDIPHLLTPVVTEPHKAVYALKWAVREMENRYRGMSHLGVRNIENYNMALKQAIKEGRQITRTVQTGFDPETGRPAFEDQPINMKPLPYIVVVVDEMADLMMVAGKDIESAVQRLAQMARAAGIHVIMATQRPSVDVITGTIKANFPTRISFQVTSRFDSRTILGEQGAEQLLGRGDMLFMEAGGRIQRIHGPFVSDEEVDRIVTFLKSQGKPDYVTNVCDESSDFGMDTGGRLGGGGDDDGDDLYRQAVEIVKSERKASTSFIQRRLQIGYNRAARLIEQMEAAGIVSTANHVGKREVLVEE